MDAHALSPAEFCALEQALVMAMKMRKKRNIEMAPMQDLKVKLLECVAEANPTPEAFASALAAAVVEVSEGQATGPAQAIASDLQMDWELACSSPGFVEWLRRQR